MHAVSLIPIPVPLKCLVMKYDCILALQNAVLPFDENLSPFVKLYCWRTNSALWLNNTFLNMEGIRVLSDYDLFGHKLYIFIVAFKEGKCSIK